MSTQFPGTHSVQVYERDSDLIKSVAAMLAASLAFGDSALVVATPEHRDQLARELGTLAVDLSRCAAEGRYVALDAAQVLSSVLRNGVPDRGLFDANFGNLREQARQHASNHNHGLTVYGECVALLWDHGEKQAALMLEAFWDDVFSDDRSFHLHCAYPSSVFADESELRQIQGLHSRLFSHSLSQSSAP